MNEHTRCGFVAILGEPNAGKSTLVNQMVGKKISIVSSKVQTTRMKVLGIVSLETAQILLVDTPGIFDPRRRLDRAMVKAAWSTIHDVDQVTVIIDASNPRLEGSEKILEELKNNRIEPLLALNKIDVVPKEQLLALADTCNKSFPIKATFMISAREGDGVQDFLNYLASNLPKSPFLYPADQISDMSQRMLAAEITRERVFAHLHQELPYAITVETDAWEEFDNGSVKITQTIYVQKTGQRIIVLGKDGQMIRKIGAEAREEISYSLERKVHLFLHVKVEKDWSEKRPHYRAMGLEFNV